MNTLYDLGQAIAQIRDAADALEIKGAKNAELVMLIFQTSNNIIIELNNIIQNKKEENDGKTNDQVGESDGKIDS